MEIATFSWEILLFLFCVAVLAGLLDTLAGGGGLLALPALIMCGVPPLLALGTNKLQGSMGTATASYLMLKRKRVRWNDVRFMVLFALLGASVGTVVVQFINTKALSLIIPLVLLGIMLFFIFSAKLLKEGGAAKISMKRYRRFVVPVIGVYDGMFGPGTGSFFSMAGVSLRGQSLVDATAVAKTLNFATNLASLCVFIVAGQVMWIAGAVMMLGQVIGAYLGAHYLYRINPAHLRILVVCMCFAMLMKYMWSYLFVNP